MMAPNCHTHLMPQKREKTSWNTPSGMQPQPFRNDVNPPVYTGHTTRNISTAAYCHAS